MLQFVLAFRSKRLEVIERHARSRYKNRFSRRENPPPLAGTLLARPWREDRFWVWLMAVADYWRGLTTGDRVILLAAIDIGQLWREELSCQMMPF